MKTWMMFNSNGGCSCKTSDADALLVAKKGFIGNLVIETDTQFVPMKINKAWVLGAYADRGAEWFETTPQFAYEKIASDSMYKASQTVG